MAFFARCRQAVHPAHSTRRAGGAHGARTGRPGVFAAWQAMDDDPILFCDCDDDTL